MRKPTLDTALAGLNKVVTTLRKVQANASNEADAQASIAAAAELRQKEAEQTRQAARSVADKLEDLLTPDTIVNEHQKAA